LDHFGEPDRSIRFGDGTIRDGEEHFPPVIDIMIWRPDDVVDIGTFSTIGMSERPMSGVDYRVELHFAIRWKSFTAEDENQIARFLANLATYPFHYKTHLNWWHSLSDPGSIPLFSKGMSVLFHPRFVEDGWDTITHKGQSVKILSVVPITAEERILKSESGIDGLCDHWAELNMDLLKPR
jgi:hypothetical protein